MLNSRVRHYMYDPMLGHRICIAQDLHRSKKCFKALPAVI